MPICRWHSGLSLTPSVTLYMLLVMYYRFFLLLFCCSLFLLLVWLGFSYHSKNFHSYGHVTITGEGLQNFINAQHLWQLCSEGSLACHTYCDTGHTFIMVNSKEPWHSTPIADISLAVELSLPVFYDLGLSKLGFEHSTFRMLGERSNRRRFRRGLCIRWTSICSHGSTFCLILGMRRKSRIDAWLPHFQVAMAHLLQKKPFKL